MDIPVSVRNFEEPAVLRSEVMGCPKQELENGALPAELVTRCTRPSCNFTVQQGLFGHVSDNNAPCEFQRLRQELLEGRFTPPSLEV